LERESQREFVHSPFSLNRNQLSRGNFLSQQQEAKKREQWAQILFRQAKNWLTERGRETAGSVEQGLEYARSAAERAADKGVEYSRRLNPLHREVRRRFFGIL